MLGKLIKDTHKLDLKELRQLYNHIRSILPPAVVYQQKPAKCGCKKCKAMKVWKTRHHPWYDQAFWESINGGKTDRHMGFKYRMARIKLHDEEQKQLNEILNLD